MDYKTGNQLQDEYESDPHYLALKKNLLAPIYKKKFIDTHTWVNTSTRKVICSVCKIWGLESIDHKQYFTIQVIERYEISCAEMVMKDILE